MIGQSQHKAFLEQVHRLCVCVCFVFKLSKSWFLFEHTCPEAFVGGHLSMPRNAQGQGQSQGESVCLLNSYPALTTGTLRMHLVWKAKVTCHLFSYIGPR